MTQMIQEVPGQTLRFSDIVGWRVISHLNNPNQVVFIHFLHRINSNHVTVKSTVDEMRREFVTYGIP